MSLSDFFAALAWVMGAIAFGSFMFLALVVIVGV